MEDECTIKRRDEEIRKRKNGRMEENPTRIRNRGANQRLMYKTKVTLSSLQELRINKTQVRRKSSNRVLYTVTQRISSHEMQEQQEGNQTGEGNTRKAADQVDQRKNGAAKDPAISIDSMLPSPNSPNFINVDDGFIEEVVGGMDGGCQEKTSNLQDGFTK
ncbi:hypothetical protein EJD97_021330 [Solanum chilense]|uniref:Uncharacterized protein n=1 Tax=Solanum chilense TaxID=4083 RepID=A0A6N2CCH1_SOLCI|nr:hypothetical protein EJD97_021330 [Solanum chilense]